MKYPNGWDETLQVGELVTAYSSGYHIIHGFVFRDKYPPIVEYVRVVNAKGEAVKSKTKLTCDASFVRRVSRVRIEADWEEEVLAADRRKRNLLEYVG